MNKRVTVLTDIEGCSVELTNMLTKLKDFESVCNELTALISDTSKWSGEGQKKCVEIHDLIVRYEENLRPMCENLKKEIDNLIISTEEFSSESGLVNCLRG